MGRLRAMEVDSTQRRRIASVAWFDSRTRRGPQSERLVRSDCGQSTSITYFYVKPMVYNKLYHRKAQKGTGLDGLLGTIICNTQI